MPLSSFKSLLPTRLLRPAAQAMNASAVITHSQKLTRFIQHSLNLFPDKMPMDAPTDYQESEGIMNRLL